MKELDPQKAARVWQRVQRENQEPEASPRGNQRMEHLPALIMEQQQLSAAYLHLSRQVPGKDGSVFVRLARESKAQAVCLKGILTLMAGAAPMVGAAPAQISPLDAMLRRCYGQELRLQKEYEGRKGDAEYGPVFDRMAQRSKEHCCAVAELIGGIGRK